MRNTFLHPFGITLLIASLVLAGLMFFVRGSERAYWIILLGFLAYAASSAVLLRTPRIKDPAKDPKVEPDPPDLLSDFVDESLRHLHQPAFLSQCQLISLLAGSLASIPFRDKGNETLELAPLEKAQALREVLMAAIEQLRPPGAPTGLRAPGALQFHILHERYVEARPVAYILTSLNIAEATYFRNRKDAILALARHLGAQEESIRQGQTQG